MKAVEAGGPPGFGSEGPAALHGPTFHEYLGVVARADSDAEVWGSYIKARENTVRTHFPRAIGIDDFLFRSEVAMAHFGFTGANTIAITTLCRDEITMPLKEAIGKIYGWAFSAEGLGGYTTCGVTGIGAGLSHSPKPADGKERYVFFSFPHIAIDAGGRIGKLQRPGRPGSSCACGALEKSRQMIVKKGIDTVRRMPTDPMDPELTLLARRCAEVLAQDGPIGDDLNLVQVTKAAAKAAEQDLANIISKTVNTAKADYVVISGVQIHSWGQDFEDASPNMEFICPLKTYAVVDGERTDFDVLEVSAPTPRQLHLLSGEQASALTYVPRAGMRPVPAPAPIPVPMAVPAGMPEADKKGWSLWRRG